MITSPTGNPSFQERSPGYAHQNRALHDEWRRKYYALFWEQGLGKTKTTIEQAVMLYLSGEIDGVLIMAPKGAFLNWIIEEIPKHVPSSVKYRSAFYSCGMRTRDRRKADHLTMHAEDNVLDFFAVNIEALSTSLGFTMAVNFCRSHYAMGVVDESTFIKSPNAKRTKSTIQVGRFCDYRRILSGTPMTQGPLDLYSQMEFLNPGLSGHRSFTSFRSEYAQIVTMTMGTRSFPKVVGFRNQPELSRKLLTFSDRKTKQECLDLPEKVFETAFVEWTPDQERAYRALRDSALAEFEKGTVSVTNALTTLTRLHQINCGYLPADDGTIIPLESNRLDTMIDLVACTEGKILIWARFRQDITTILEALRKEYGDKSAVDYYGGTTLVERAENLVRFRQDPDCRFFVANAASAGRSLTLVEACTTIYYSLSYSLEEWLQSQDRNHRIGQTKQVTYHTLAVPNTVDTKLLKALQGKHDVATSILDNYRQMLEID